MQYGYFDEKNNEYVITRPDTPTPWMNYLGVDDKYVAMISNTAGGYSYHISAAFKSLTRYRYNAIPMDRPGRYIYIKDEETKDYWSSTWQPVIKPLDKYKYECRHGLNYTKIKTEYAGIQSSNLYFVPVNKDFEIWQVKIKNMTSKTRNLNIFTYTEFCVWCPLKDIVGIGSTLSETEMEYKEGTVYHYSYTDPGQGLEDMSFRRYYAFFTSNIKPQTFDIRREKFIGLYRDESNPEAIEKGSCSNYQVKGENPIASFQILLTLKPNQEKTLIFILGVTNEKYEEKKYIKKYLTVINVKKEFEKLNKYWQKYLSSFQVKTPEKMIDSITNIWNPYQGKIEHDKRITWYYTYRGGYGFRDRNQKTMGLVHFDSELTKKTLLILAKIQYKNGDCSHGYDVINDKSGNGGFSDDPLWFVYAVCAYVKETGDFDFLKEVVPFKDGGKSSIYEKIKLCCDWTFKNLGPHKLPLTGIADWNDCLNQKDGGESQMVACQLVKAAYDIKELAEFLNKEEDVKKYDKIANTMKNTINQVTWDGEWYLRCFDKFGNIVGSNKNKEGKIFLNSQIWAIISNVADRKRAICCMEQVKKYLSSKYGLALLYPAYKSYNPVIGTIGIFLPGLKENGGIFCHPNAWAVIAECMLGKGNQAMEYFKNYAPYFKNDIAEIIKTEPYAYTEYYASCEHSEFGCGRDSWYTGSVPWSYIALTQYILGIRPQYNGLLIDPCIPNEWNGFKVDRKFRGNFYKIEVKNPNKVSYSVKEILVDGKKITGNLVPIFKDKKIHNVIVIMG